MVLNYAILLFFTPLSVNIQTDSLQNALELAKGKERVVVLNKLYKQYANNDPIKAVGYTRMALELARELNDEKGIASSYNNIGVIYKNQGELDKALEYYLKALRIQEANQYVNALAYSYSNIGTIYSLQREYDKALEYFTRASDQLMSLGHKEKMIGALSNIGNVYEAQGHYDQALEYYQKALSIYEEVEDHAETFVPFNNIGNIHFAKGNYEYAMAYYESALHLEKINNDLNGQANALHNIGTVYKTLEDYDLALDHFNQSLSIVQETDNKRLLAIIYQSMAETYFAMGDMFLAYSFLRLNTLAKDSLYNEESSRKIAKLEGAYQLEQKESEIDALTMETQLQQLQIKNDKIIMVGGAIISLLGVALTLVIFKKYKQIRRNKYLLEQQNDELEQQKLVIEDKNQSITESIDYAKSVQTSLLQFQVTPEKLSKSFLLFKPKDIVSGDFFWYADRGDVDIVAAVDCTGHGVAGAFMTVIGISVLEQIVNKDKVDDPALILDQLNMQVRNAIKQRERVNADHSMDAIICKVDHAAGQITYAGANRPLYYFKDGDFGEIKGTKRTIGDAKFEHCTDFKKHTISFSKGDAFYLTSDGYADQFGGKKGKKFMIGRFKQLLHDIQPLNIGAQKEKLRQTIISWQGGEEQTDDILIIGFKL